MSEPLVSATVNFWARRVGPRVVFDHDDARQEARIAVWQSEGRGAHVYRRILDAMRKLIPGFKVGNQPIFEDEHPEAIDCMTPDLILQAKRRIERIETLPEPEKSIVLKIMAGQTSKQIAQEYGISASRVSQRLKNAYAYIEQG